MRPIGARASAVSWCRPACSYGLVDAYGGGVAFQVLALQPGAIPQGGGLVRYGPEFALVS